MIRKPVVFIPGFPGSELSHEGRKVYPPPLERLVPGGRRLVQLLERLRGPETHDGEDRPGSVFEADEIVLHGTDLFGWNISPQAATLVHRLEALGYQLGVDFLPVPWDWRRPIDHARTLDSLAAAIRDLSVSGEKVVVVAHSTGGLVVRALLENRDERARDCAARIDHIVALGVPWLGTLKTMASIRGAETLVRLFEPMATRKALSHSWAAYDLMPPGPQDVDMTENGAPIVFYTVPNNTTAAPLENASWVPTDFVDEYLVRAPHAHNRLGRRTRQIRLPEGADLPITNLVGYGTRTHVRCDVSRTRMGTRRVRFATSDDGDQTVPRQSASWLSGPGIRTFEIPLGIDMAGGRHYHSQLWETQAITLLLERILVGGPQTPVVHVAVDSHDVQQRQKYIDVRVAGYQPDGSPLKDFEATFGRRSRQNSGKVWRLDPRGQTVMRYERYPAENLHRYHCHIRLQWTYNGETDGTEYDIRFIV